MPGAEGRPARLRATFMRGGTSKGLMFLRDDLPAERSLWDGLFLSAMGSPDPYGRQLDGMGGGISSLSKICVVGPSTRAGADVDYTFGQVLVSEARVDYSGNCGNMSSAVGPFALLAGLDCTLVGDRATVVIHNTNTGKLIRSTFPVADVQPVFEGDFEIDGVAGTGAPIRLDFLDPGGSKTGRLLPTGQVAERIAIDGLDVGVTLIDAASPCLFIDAADLGMAGPMTAEAMDGEALLLDRLERLRCVASMRMGLCATPVEAARLGSVPKVALVFAPQAHALMSGRRLAADEVDIVARMISMGKPHRALPMTGAICLAAALRLEGSVPARLAGRTGSPLRLGHPSGVVSVDAQMGKDRTGSATVLHGSVLRTARRLFEGEVFC